MLQGIRPSRDHLPRIDLRHRTELKHPGHLVIAAKLHIRVLSLGTRASMTTRPSPLAHDSQDVQFRK
jgi:hypothetical protein